jgi:ferredoxin
LIIRIKEISTKMGSWKHFQLLKAAYNKWYYFQHSLGMEYCTKCNICRKLRPSNLLTEEYSDEE